MTRLSRPHRAWLVAAVAFVALIGAAGFRATPGVLMVPLQEEFGWSADQTSLAVAVNLVLYGLTAPFAAALMNRFGIRPVVTVALVLVSAGSGLTVFMTASWQLVLCWGFLVGLGTGSMALVFAATVAERWFEQRRGLVVGVLTAGGATGQLIFLPVLAVLAEDGGWRTASLVVALAALAVVPLVLAVLRNHPSDVGLRPYGATADVPPPQIPKGAARVALRTLAEASRRPVFWLLAGGFFICGMSTNGLVGTHFIPAAHDHGMPQTTAAGLLAVIGIFDVLGTIFSGWLTDRVDPRWLLGWYYALRGLSLFVLPVLFADGVHPGMLVFILFYGLDWVATVPPTVALARRAFGVSGTIVFGWVFASHQLGAAAAAGLAGLIRADLGTYDPAWYVAGALCLGAAVMSIAVRTSPERLRQPAETQEEAAPAADAQVT
ncbi:MAG: MFS transporter [Streptosporangiales bacterium]|nr:MFS transporter [Streptosporangiales bacterium]